MTGLTHSTETEAEAISRAFRSAMRGVASTVTLIAVEHDGRRHGMIATAMMSVSLEPPSLAVCINRSASIHEPLRLRGAMSVNVLSERQQHISEHFTRCKPTDRFNCGDWISYKGQKTSLAQIPYLSNANAVFLGCVSDQIAFGTHTLFIAEIDESVQPSIARPLVYCDGSYGSFAV